MVAQVEAINSAGVFVDPNGMFAGSISTGEVNYHYQGTLSSASARYAFTGENQFAVGVAVKIGPVSAKFAGKIALSDITPPHSYKLSFDDRTSGPINAIYFDWKHGTLWGGSSNHGEDYGIGW